jgi:hypothetical protein
MQTGLSSTVNSANRQIPMRAQCDQASGGTGPF